MQNPVIVLLFSSIFSFIALFTDFFYPPNIELNTPGQISNSSLICDPDLEREALISLYVATDGDNWVDSWDTTALPNTWNSIFFFNTGCLWNINIDGNGLDGTLPDELGNFGEIDQIKIVNNPELEGTLPLSIVNLESTLLNLVLYGNNLSGPIPEEYSQLTNLSQCFCMEDNNLSGELPSSLGNLDQVVFFAVSRNNFTGSIPASYGNLGSAVFFFAGGNNLGGELPEELSMMDNLQQLDLSQNQFEGNLPLFLGDMESIQIALFFSNQFTGGVPLEWANSSTVSNIAVSDNLLDTMSAFPQAWLNQLSTLDIRKNYLTFDDVCPNMFPNLFYDTMWNFYPDTIINANLGQNLVIDLGIDPIYNGVSSYTWIKGEDTLTTVMVNALEFNNLQESDAGVYRVAVTNPCAPDLTLHSNTITINVEDNCILGGTVTTTDALCGASNGSASVSIEGDNGNAIANWSTGATEINSINNLSAGDYWVVLEESPCTSDTIFFSIEDPAAPVLELPETLVICAGESQAITPQIANCQACSFQWTPAEIVDNPNAQNVIVSPTTNTTLTLIITDDNNCTASQTINLMIDNPSVEIEGALFICPNGGSTTLTALTNNSSGNLLWSTNATSESIQVDTPGDYAITFTTTNNCNANASVSIDEFEVQAIDIQGDSNICAGTTTLLQATSGFTNYLWSTGETDSQILVNSEDLYGLTVTDSEGCTNSTEFAVTVSEIPEAFIIPQGNQTAICDNETVILEGPVGMENYMWSTLETERVIEVNEPGIYTLTVFQNDCSADASIEITSTSVPETQETIMDCGCIELEGEIYCEEVVVPITYNSVEGCDSLVSFHLIPLVPENFTPCLQEEIIACSEVVILSCQSFPEYGLTGTWSGGNNQFILDPSSPITSASDLNLGANYFYWELSSDLCGSFLVDTVIVNVEGLLIANDDKVKTFKKVPIINFDLLANDSVPAEPVFNVKKLPTTEEAEVIIDPDGTVDIFPNLSYLGNFELIYEICTNNCSSCSEAKLSVEVDKPSDDDFPDYIVCPECQNNQPFNPIPNAEVLYPDNSFVLINRWGDVVFTQAPYDGTWNGINKQGGNLPGGTYYYIFRLDLSEGELLVGTITILR